MFAKRKQTHKSFSSDEKQSDDDESENNTSRDTTDHFMSAKDSVTGGFNKEGYIFKKQSQSLFSAWDKRYIVLKNHILNFYQDHTK
jgi:hypothetical protein